MRKFLNTHGFMRAAIFTTLLGFTSFVQAQSLIKRFEKVSDGIFRSGRPTIAQIADLKKQGFKAIIDLENKADVVSAEQKKAQSLGIKFISVPLDWNQAPTDQQADFILASLRDQNIQPVLIHCFHGEDRTGLMVGLYRVQVEGTPPQTAYQEMLQKGFHTKFTEMVNFFKKRTGMN